MQEFFSMSGYGAYVWSCYVLTFVVLAWNLIASRRELKQQQLRARRRAEAAAGSTS
jgi:heme exporter protein CcmD